MELKAKIIGLLPLQSGSGKNGTWKKQEFIVETDGKFPKKVCMSLWGDNVDKFPLEVNSVVNISFDVESREYNGRWYTECRSWKVDKLGVGAAQSAEPMETNFSMPSDFGSSQDDLPF